VEITVESVLGILSTQDIALHCNILSGAWNCTTTMTFYKHDWLVCKFFDICLLYGPSACLIFHALDPLLGQHASML
jgi:hypothetical protein